MLSDSPLEIGDWNSFEQTHPLGDSDPEPVTEQEQTSEPEPKPEPEQEELENKPENELPQEITPENYLEIKKTLPRSEETPNDDEENKINSILENNGNSTAGYNDKLNDSIQKKFNERKNSPNEIQEEEADSINITSQPDQVYKDLNKEEYDALTEEERDSLDKSGFTFEGKSVSRGFFSDSHVKKTFCKVNPKSKLCIEKGVLATIIQYIKAILSSMAILGYFSIFIILIIFFFFRIPVYFNEISLAISNGYMEFYEKQNPVMIITEKERSKLNSLNMLFINSLGIPQKKSLLAKLFGKKNKEEEKEKPKDAEEEEEEKFFLIPKVTSEVIDTFDGREYSIVNKNLKPVALTFDVIDKKFGDMSEFIIHTIQQDTIYYEVEIEQVLGSTEIILGKPSHTLHNSHRILDSQRKSRSRNKIRRSSWHRRQRRWFQHKIRGSISKRKNGKEI